MLLDKGADANAENGYGSTLRAAVRRGNATIIKMLLDKNAEIVAGIGQCKITLCQRNLEIVKILLNSQKTRLEETPLEETPLEETQLEETPLEETQFEETQLEEKRLEEKQ